MGRSTLTIVLYSLIFFVPATLLGASFLPRPAPTLDPVQLMEEYGHGDYTAVTSRLEMVSDVAVLDRLDTDLKKAAKAWVEAGDVTGQRRRALAAGAVALELTHFLVERESWANTNRGRSHAVHPEALPEIHRIIADQSVPPDALEHAWTLAQLATWQQWNAVARRTDVLLTPEPVWAVLLGKPQLSGAGITQAVFGSAGLLGEALARFPEDSRLLLAVAEGHESVNTRCPTQYCFDELTVGTLDDLHRRAAARPPDLAGYMLAEARRSFAFASANLKAFDQLLPAAAEFAALANANPDVREEASVHIGYLAIRAARPDAALGPLATAVASADPYVSYLANYFTGRALTMLGRHAEAIAAFRRALVTLPGTPSASTLLAAQLFMSDEAGARDEARDVLDAARNADSSRDPWQRYWYGDARLWPTYIELLRKALSQ